MEIWDFQGQNSDEELLFYLGTHVNVQIFKRVHVSKCWLYQITWSIFGNLALTQVFERELIPFERCVHRHSLEKTLGTHDRSNREQHQGFFYALFPVWRLEEGSVPPHRTPHAGAPSSAPAAPKIRLGRSSAMCEAPAAARTFGLDISSLTLSELLHRAFEVFNSALFSLSVNWQFKKYFVNIESFWDILIFDVQATWILISFFNFVSLYYAF